MLEKRGDVADPNSPRAGHIEHAKAALASGDLLIAGALADPVDEALFVWKGDAKAAAEDFGALSSLQHPPELQQNSRRLRPCVASQSTAAAGAAAASPAAHCCCSCRHRHQISPPLLFAARSDPYVTRDLVPSWSVRTWSVVIGGDKLDPGS